MAYPDTLLTRRTRIGIMLGLMACFFVISPLIILYTAGYRYDVSSKTIKETGVISIDTEPQDAEVYLNDIKIEKKLPIRLSNRAPGLYRLRIHKEGYQDWTKDIEVKSKQTTYIKNITLFPIASPKKLRHFSEAIVDAAFSPDGRFLLSVSQDNTVYEVRLHDITTNEEIPIVRDTTEESPHVSWSPVEQTATVLFMRDGASYIHIFSALRSDTVKVYTATGTPAGAIQWSEGQGNPEAYVQTTDQQLHRISLSGFSTFTTITSSIWFVDEAGAALWTYEEGTALLKQQKDGKEFIFSLPIKIKQFIDINDQRLIVQTSQNDYAVIPRSGQQLGDVTTLPTKQIVYNQATREWITWSESEIWNVYPDGTVSLLNRTSEKMETVLPLDQFGVLLIQTANGILAFNPGYYTTHTLFPIKNGLEKLAVHMKNRQIYLFGRVNNEYGIYSLSY